MKKGLVFGVFCVIAVSVHADLTAMQANVNQLKLQQQQLELQHGVNCQCLRCRETRAAVFVAEAAQQGASGQQNGSGKGVRKSDAEIAAEVKLRYDGELKSLGVTHWFYMQNSRGEGARIDASFYFQDNKSFTYHRYHKFGTIPTPVAMVLKWRRDNGLGVVNVVQPGQQPAAQAEAPVAIVESIDSAPVRRNYKTENSFVNAWVGYKLSRLTAKEREKISHSLSGMKGYKRKLEAEARKIWRGQLSR